MVKRKTAYEISASQVWTPSTVVSFFWELLSARRPDGIGTVLDMGAGDCRFAIGGAYRQYTGVEIDKTRGSQAVLPARGDLRIGCVFKHPGTNYDACIGNPPYVRHHDVEEPWKEETLTRLDAELGVRLHRNCNLYLYFLCLGLLKSRDHGVVALVIPYEWVSRPSAGPVRRYIADNNWDVSVYRFQAPIFKGVLTTASVTIIDKGSQLGRWSYHDVTPDLKVVPKAGPADSADGVLAYEPRGDAWALRGMSPGSQKIFTLTEGERIHNGLRRRDVMPCVTTLRHLPDDVAELTSDAFQAHYVAAGRKCWLIRSHVALRSNRLDEYLKAVREEDRRTHTCQNREEWFRFQLHPVPKLLVASGFVRRGPKTLVNTVQARAVGSVFGVHSNGDVSATRLRSHIVQVNFETRVVAHAKTLKKVEVRQLNGVLNKFFARA